MSDKVAEENLPHQEPTSAVEQYLEKNFKKLILLLLAVVVGLLAYGFIRYKKHQAAVAAAEQFTAAKTVEDCDLVISQHPGTAATGNARLLKADLLWEENKKDSSTSVLREFLKENQGHPLYATGMLGLASKLESMGEADEARELFERIANEHGDAAVAPLARIRLGDLLWSQGKEDEATGIYESLATDFPDTNEPFYDQSQSRLEWLAAKLPTNEVEPPASVKAAEKAAAEAKQAADLPIGLKPPQINVDGTLGATISPDGGAMTPPITPPPAPTTPPASDAKSPPKKKPAAAKSGADKKSEAKAKAKAPAKKAGDSEKKAKDSAKKAADGPKKASESVKKSAEAAKAKAADAKAKATPPTPKPAKPAPTPAKEPKPAAEPAGQ